MPFETRPAVFRREGDAGATGRQIAPECRKIGSARPLPGHAYHGDVKTGHLSWRRLHHGCDRFWGLFGPSNKGSFAVLGAEESAELSRGGMIEQGRDWYRVAEALR